ncbi:MAG TPA: shikimate dehydrogenase [Candidatus Limnocylindria bacterium]
MSRVVLVGHPVKHSLSPAMQNAAFAALRLPHRYEVLDVAPAALAAAVTRFRTEDVLGVNVTIPHKEAAVRLVDEVDDDVRHIGALNTIVRRGTRFVGANTDLYGCEMSIRGVLERRRVLLLGAGGAARACAYALLRMGNSVHVANRTPDRAEKLAREIELWGEHPTAVSWPRRGEPMDVDGVVNATPLGLAGDDPLEGIPLPHVVVDIVPTAEETALVRRAREAQDVMVVDGLVMLLYQAARSFELWTGVPAPIEAMRAALPRPV